MHNYKDITVDEYKDSNKIKESLEDIQPGLFFRTEDFIVKNLKKGELGKIHWSKKMDDLMLKKAIFDLRRAHLYSGNKF